MNLTDLCADGLEKYAEWQVWNATRNNAPYISVINQAGRSYQAYLEHVRDCELCTQEELGDDRQHG